MMMGKSVVSGWCVLSLVSSLCLGHVVAVGGRVGGVAWSSVVHGSQGGTPSGSAFQLCMHSFHHSRFLYSTHPRYPPPIFFVR